jgi:outer membrane protein
MAARWRKMLAACMACLAGLLAGCAARTAAAPARHALSYPGDHAYTLDELIELSVQRNASLDVARHEAEAAQGLVDQVKALWLPMVRYTFSLIALDNDYNYKADVFGLTSLDVPVTGNYNVVNAGALAQILYTGGKRTSGLNQAKMFATLKRLDVLRQQDAIAEQVATFYHLVCLTDDLDKVLDDVLRRIRVFHQVSANLNLRGSLRGTRLDTLQADYFASQLEQLRLALRGGRHQAYLALKHFVGLRRDEPMLLKSVSLPPAYTDALIASRLEAVARGFQARPELKELDLFTKIREQQVRFAKAGWLPNIALLGLYTDVTGNNHSVLGVLDGLLVSLIVDVPIYDPALRGRLREALGLEQAALAFQREIEDLITLEIEVTAVDAQRALATLLLAERARRTAHEHYAVARQAYTRELTPGGDVVTAIVLDMLARAQYLQSLFAYHQAHVRLIRVTADREARLGY